MKKRATIYHILFLLQFALVAGCKKMLDEKSDQSLSTISRFKDLQGLVRTYSIMNTQGGSQVNLGADEYILSSSDYANLPVNYRQAYAWDKVTQIDAWGPAYRVVYYANVVLQGLNDIADGTTEQRNVVKGEALFFRAFTYYHLAQAYCKPYSSSAATDPGISLRATPDVEETIFRASVAETYARIIEDTKEAIELLPLRSNAQPRPSKISGYAFLARVYLSMREYSEAEHYASLYLAESSELMDYNEIDTTANPAISTTNVESVFYNYYVDIIPGPSTQVNPELINLYDQDDLRRSVLYVFNHDGTANFKGSYEGMGGYVPFCGLATDEVFLIRAECRARASQLDAASEDLNTLLSKRFKTGSYEPIVFTNSESAVNIIIQERRKELVFRGTRWSDLRRLNLEGANINLQRNIDGTNFSLPANDKRWVWLIPESVIRLSGIIQNER